MPSSTNSAWPQLPATAEWEACLHAVHLWSQIIGKVRLAHMPPMNHYWHSTLYVSAKGLSTHLIPHAAGAFEIEFDFINHQLHIQKVDGTHSSFPLEAMSAADFYHKTFNLLNQLRLHTSIYPKPVELPDPILPFPEDVEKAPYDAQAVHAFWLALTNVQRVFASFRNDFVGKVSPIHFFWGAFDLAMTRFSGRKAPTHPGGVPNCPDYVMQESYSHELSSAGFWPGTGLGEAAFYAYAYPEPDGYRQAEGLPEGAWYAEDMGEYLLPYAAVVQAANSDEALLQFLRSTYEAAAIWGRWDREALER
ncbi:MAG TPA: DUF5996 family protein [Cyclobacteriaceae bacterium]|nr:DUF5996 family protein [Cyclobacteriaceae bacterium]